MPISPVKTTDNRGMGAPMWFGLDLGPITINGALLLGIGALLSGVGGFMAARAAMKQAKSEGDSECRKELAAARAESEDLATEMHHLRMRLESGDHGESGAASRMLILAFGLLAASVVMILLAIWSLTGPHRGPTGPVGPPGSVGPPGPAGEDGTTTVSGGTGGTGQTGGTGGTGSTGQTGGSGATGEAGSTGSAGATGATGAPGATGERGIAGAIGPPGAAGSAGAPGVTGVAGPPGSTGAPGAKGDPGPQGPAGTMCPSGFKPMMITINQPGGKQSVLVCVPD